MIKYGSGHNVILISVTSALHGRIEIKLRASSASLITNDIRLAMNRRYKLVKSAVTSKNVKLWWDYKRARNNVTSDLRRAKASYFSKMFNEVRTEFECL